MARVGYKDSVVTGSAPKEVLKFAENQKYYMKIVSEFMEVWSECWPCFESDGKRHLRRFVVDGEGANVIAKNKKFVDIPKDKETSWNVKGQNAVLVVLGTPQKVKKDGKTITKVIWDTQVKIWAFGVKAHRRLKSIDDDEALTERREEKSLESDLPNSQVFSLTLEKVKTGSGTEYDINAYKLVGEPDVSTLDDFEEVSKKLADYATVTPTVVIENFFSSEHSERAGGAEAEAVEESDEEEKPAKKSSKKAAAAEEVEEEEEEAEEKPAKKSSKKKDDEVEEEEEEEEAEEKPAKKSSKKKPADEDEEEVIDVDEIEEEEEEKPAKKSSKKKPAADDDEEE